MITKIRLHNWKSFRDSTLYIEQMSLLIGTNASGKSNALDALDFLQRLASGNAVEKCVRETRGGSDWLIHKGHDEARLTAYFSDAAVAYTYSVALRQTSRGIVIDHEELCRDTRQLFTTLARADSGLIDARVYTGKQGQPRRMDLYANTCLLSQMEGLNVAQDIKDVARHVLRSLRDIFILQPQPNRMRQYVPLASELEKDGGNIAGVLAGKPDAEKEAMEATISSYLHKLPERDVERVWTERVGRFASDAMLYCEEKWTATSTVTLDARGMSDGTLRFVAIVLALLSRQEHSLLVVEEIDNGLHPSRSRELARMLSELGEKRHIDILCTTHNPVLIDELGPEMIPFISGARRDANDGSSLITRLDDRADLLNVLASGTVGDNMVNGKI